MGIIALNTFKRILDLILSYMPSLKEMLAKDNLNKKFDLGTTGLFAY